jgi:hypothetical protein
MGQDGIFPQTYPQPLKSRTSYFFLGWKDSEEGRFFLSTFLLDYQQD